MDLRFIAVVMIIMAILDFLGRLARKRAGLAQSEDGDALDGVDVLKALTGEDGRGSGRGEARAAAIPQARVGGDQGVVPAVVQRAEAVAPPAGRVPAAAPPVPIRGSRVLELRDRAPREIQVRSREPRAMEERPSPKDLQPPGEVAVGGGSPAGTAKAASPAGHSSVAVHRRGQAAGAGQRRRPPAAGGGAGGAGAAARHARRVGRIRSGRDDRRFSPAGQGVRSLPEPIARARRTGRSGPPAHPAPRAACVRSTS